MRQVQTREGFGVDGTQTPCSFFYLIMSLALGLSAGSRVRPKVLFSLWLSLTEHSAWNPVNTPRVIKIVISAGIYQALITCFKCFTWTDSFILDYNPVRQCGTLQNMSANSLRCLPLRGGV